MAPRDELEIWIDRDYVPAGYGWSFPARDEIRIGVGSFDPRFHVKEPTVRLAEDLDSRGGPLPGQLDPAQASRRDRRRCLLRRRLGRPLPAADRRGDPHRLLLRDRLRPRAAAGVEGRHDRATALASLRRVLGRARVEVQLDASHAAAGPDVPPRLLDRSALRGDGAQAVSSHWSFGHYLRIAVPSVARTSVFTIRTVPARSRTIPSTRGAVIACCSSPRKPKRSSTTDSETDP